MFFFLFFDRPNALTLYVSGAWHAPRLFYLHPFNDCLLYAGLPCLSMVCLTYAVGR